MKVTIRQRANTDATTARLYFDICDAGKRTRTTSKLFVYVGKRLTSEQKTHNSDAMEKAEAEKKRIEKGTTAGSEGVTTLSDLFQHYVGSKTKKGQLSEQTAKSYCQTLKYIDGAITLKELDQDTITELYDAIKASQQISNNTKVVYISKLDAVLRYGAKMRLYSADILFSEDKPKNEREERVYLTADELQVMIDDYKQTGKNWMRCFLFSCLTGLRYSDVKALRWNDISEGVIRLRQQKTKSVVKIPLGDAVSLLPPMGKDAVFTVPDCSGMRKNLQGWAKDHNINKSISFHTARHTFATLSLLSGAELYTISKLLGHKSINTTQIYADVVDESREEAVKGLGKLVTL